MDEPLHALSTINQVYETLGHYLFRKYLFVCRTSISVQLSRLYSICTNFCRQVRSLHRLCTLCLVFCPRGFITECVTEVTVTECQLLRFPRDQRRQWSSVLRSDQHLEDRRHKRLRRSLPIHLQMLLLRLVGVQLPTHDVSS